jgi:hypothetical protein
MLCHVEGSETCLRLYAGLQVMLVLCDFDILTLYFECMFIVCVCVCVCVCLGGRVLLILYVIDSAILECLVSFSEMIDV